MDSINDIRKGDITALVATIFSDLNGFIDGNRIIQIIPSASDNELIFQILLQIWQLANDFLSRIATSGYEEAQDVLLDRIFKRIGYKLSVTKKPVNELKNLIHYVSVREDGTFLRSNFHPFNLMTKMQPVLPSYTELFEDAKKLPYVLAIQPHPDQTVTIVSFCKINYVIA